MASARTLYSCTCLNVRLRPQHPPAPPPNVPAHPDFSQLYVGEDGITMALPQVTLRGRTRGTPIAGTSRYSRYMTLTCLICELLVYRVHQTVSPDAEGKEGPIIPSEEWVEQETMKSTSGWIEIHNQCLVDDAIHDAESSSTFSSTFSLVLPADSCPPISPESAPEQSVPSAASPTLPSKSYLSNLRPLFPPAPFTPSHPVFMHISSMALDRSQALRTKAEQDITDIIEAKALEVERAEAELKQHVQAIWTKFRESIRKNQGSSLRASSRSREGSNWPATNGVGSPGYGTPVAVREFVPLAVPLEREASLSAAPRLSALSASLATSSFHYPRDKQDQISSPSNTHPTSSASNGSTNTGSSHTLPLRSQPLKTPPAEGSNVLQFKRNTNDTINTAASFRYFLNLEEDMARHKRNQQKNGDVKQQEAGQSPQAGPSQSAPTNGNKVKKNNSESQPGPDDTNSSTQRLDTERSKSHGREKDSTKGKRKVTFDVQPAVVTIKREVNAEKEEEEALADQDTGEMIFDLEDEGSERSFNSRPTLPLIEQPPQIRPTRTRKPQNTLGLPGSFPGLRPASLPVPSHIRPSRSQNGVDSSSQGMILSLQRPNPAPKSDHRRTTSLQDSAAPGKDEQSPVDPRDVEILKLVAADVPSHRGAWAPQSKAWQTFVRRQDSKDYSKSEDIPEEGEDDRSHSTAAGYTNTNHDKNQGTGAEEENSSEANDDSDYAFATTVGSLPIPIHSFLRPPETLSLASYQPKTSLDDRPGVLVPPLVQKTTSSTALRKAAYAERDRKRSMDPGALDFTTEEVEEEIDDDGIDADPSKADGAKSEGRGRKRALKILQARSELPAAGMWRSLAT